MLSPSLGLRALARRRRSTNRRANAGKRSPADVPQRTDAYDPLSDAVPLRRRALPYRGDSMPRVRKIIHVIEYAFGPGHHQTFGACVGKPLTRHNPRRSAGCCVRRNLEFAQQANVRAQLRRAACRSASRFRSSSSRLQSDIADATSAGLMIPPCRRRSSVSCEGE